MKERKELICVIGPTAVGKTDLAIELATELKTEIISCDSRQMYREMRIGTAVPSKEQLKQIRHHFIGHISIHDYYSVYEFEKNALALMKTLFREHEQLVLVGGSGLYLNALIYGMDDIPDPDPTIREGLIKRFETEGIDSLRFELKQLDPEYYFSTDIRNPKRILRGLEVCLSTGKSFSQYRIRQTLDREFSSKIICLDRDRAHLHRRINSRVDQMMVDGLQKEAGDLLPFRHLNALKTVGYRELFEAFDGKCSFAEAIELIKRNSRRYARRQITWNKRYEAGRWINLDQDINPLKSIIQAI
jgi:tRNA dimethylallyltransferase